MKSATALCAVAARRTQLGARSWMCSLCPHLSVLCCRVPSLCSSMKSTRSSSSFQGGSAGDMELSLTGLPAPVWRRPGSASPAKHMVRSVSVTAEGKPKRNTLEDAGSRAMNNLRRSNSTTQVNQQVKSTRSSDQTDFLTFFESSSGGRKKPTSLSKTSPEKKTTWNVLDDQPRVVPGPSGSCSVEPPAGMRRKEAAVLLAANFTANNRSNKGAMGNCVTTMVHNNYSTTEKGPAPKSSNQVPNSLNNVVKATSNEDGESSSFVKSQKNFSSNNIMTCNNNSSLPWRKEVTEEEAERFIQQVNSAAVTIQRWYRRHSQRHRAAAAALGRLLASKREERQQRMEEGNILDLQEKKEEERRKVREEKARLARRAAIQELHQKRAQKALDAKRLAEEELVLVKESRRGAKKKPAKATSASNGSPASSVTKANNAEANFHSVPAEPEESCPADLSSMPLQDLGAEDKLQDVSSRETGGEELETVVTAVSRAQSKVTLNELLDTLRLLEEEPELLPPPKLFKKERYAWIDGQEPSSNSLTADNLEKFGKLNHSPGVPEDGALLSEAKLQSIISFLDEMEKSEQERPRSAASATQREGLLSEEELAHLEQASAVATEVTSSIMRLKLEVEEKKRTISLLQTALVCEPDAQQRELTVRHIKQTEKELGHQLKLQRDQYEAAIQRHLSFIDQLIDDKKVLSEKCEAVVAELKQVDQKYGKKITQMQEQHELEIKKLKELMSATEKIRREKWMDEKTKKIKEITVKGLEPEIQKLIAKHKQDIRKLKLLHEAELLQSDERAAQRYSRQAEELRGLLEREKEEQSLRARQRCEQQLEQEEQALQQQRRRLYAEVAEEKERLSQQAARQRAEVEELRRQLEESSSAVTRALKEEYTKEKEEQERQHQAEVKVLKEQLEMEKQAWEANYIKKEEAWLLSRERELREELRKERDKEIELVIERLEADMSSAREECERAAENRIKRIRDKYELELQELERSERKLQERCNELKGRLAELEGESVRLQGLLKHKEQEVEEIQKVRDQLAQERSSMAEVIRQEFADKLLGMEEENKQLKVEMAEMRARQRLELDRIVQEKDQELEEVHRRVKRAVARKEENVSSLRKQYEVAVQRADCLKALLEQQRKQLLATK
ncbi:centrosomal protein of 131 kDa isoform X5 [Dryobates pubescens]|uniref:centrosomal protein of 131 kDa isoform X5 n=1 Tax=Dryobates pubescens TaxID=118200 RepID=UPI0023B9244F|nr:centrosomal protein of 131 kDa isoform X5 [Dryobates pubescens]